MEFILFLPIGLGLAAGIYLGKEAISHLQNSLPSWMVVTILIYALVIRPEWGEGVAHCFGLFALAFLVVMAVRSRKSVS